MTPEALAGIKVIEFARFAAGPYCGKLMAGLGAETVKVESPSSVDSGRNRAGFLYLNTNKLSVTVNTGHPQGKRIFLKLINTADVLISDKTEREMAQFGLEYAELRRLNPHLIITCITPFGLTGPYKDFKSYYLNTYHASGLGYLIPVSQDLSREPIKLGGFSGECACGVSAAVATLGALFWKKTTGKGQLIDVSQQEALISMNRPQAARYPNEGIIPTRVEVPAGTGGLWPCKDGHVVAIFADGRQWKSFVELMDKPAWATTEYEELSYRAVRDSETKPLIGAWMLEHTREEIFQKGQALGCPVSPVLSPEEVIEFPQFQARGFFTSIEQHHYGKITFPVSPFKLSASPWSATKTAPKLGQHNTEIYSKRLGYSVQELDKLHQEGII